MKAARKVSAVLIVVAIACLGTSGYWYLGYEQRTEIARYQCGLTDGIEIGALEARKELLNQVNCYPVVTMEADHATEEVICGVRMQPSDVESGALTRGSDLEQ